MERNYSSLSRSTRWPLGLLDDTRQRLNEEREEKAKASQIEVDNLSKELRHTQQVVAAELAGWQDMHEKMGRRAIRELARGMVTVEKMRLEGMKRALRKLHEDDIESLPNESASIRSFEEGSGVADGNDDETSSPQLPLNNMGEAEPEADADLLSGMMPAPAPQTEGSAIEVQNTVDQGNGEAVDQAGIGGGERDNT